MSGDLYRMRALLMSHWQILPLLLTLGAYAAGVALQRLGGRNALLNPTLLAIGMVVAVLSVLRIDYRTYLTAAQPVHVLLGPAVVALALPLHRHLGLIYERATLLLAALLVGSLGAIASSVMVGRWFGLSHSDLLSLAPKSATTAVSMAISAQNGGQPSVTAVLTVLTGICGAVFAGRVLDALRVHDPGGRPGVRHGTCRPRHLHRARVFRRARSRTFAGLAIGLNAIATAVLVPLVVRYLLR